MAPIEDQLLLGLDFMVHHKVDPLISWNVLVVDGQYDIPAIYKRNQSKGTMQTETYGVGRVKVSKRVVVPPNTIKLIEGKVDSTFSGSGACMVAPLCAKRGVVIPFATVHLDNNADRTIPMQVVNLSDNFVTLKKDYPLGSLEEICETLEEDEDSSSHGPNSSEPVPFLPLPLEWILSWNLMSECAPRINPYVWRRALSLLMRMITSMNHHKFLRSLIDY